MHVQGTSVLGGADSWVTGPAVGGPLWFDTEDRPFCLLVSVPLSLDLMAAALYDLPLRDARDLATDEDVRGNIAIMLVLDGLSALERRADELARPGVADDRAWLAFCRQRASEVMGGTA